MGIYIAALFKDKQFYAPAGAIIEFRSACRSRNRRRAAVHGNTNSLLRMSPARLRNLLRLAVLLTLCIVALAAAALAQEQSRPAPADPAATRIEVDEQANVIRFVIAGEERAVLDATGLHVNGDIEFNGTIADTGTDSDSQGGGRAP